MFDMVSRRGFVSLSAVAAAGLGLAGCSGNKEPEATGSDAGSAKASSKKETVELQVFAANSLEKALPEVKDRTQMVRDVLRALGQPLKADSPAGAT